MPPRKPAGSENEPTTPKKATPTTDQPTTDQPTTEPPTRNPEADPVRIHREYVQRRIGGGAQPTPQAYERALEQWHRLPGAVRTPATEVRPPDQPAERRDADRKAAAAAEAGSLEAESAEPKSAEPKSAGESVGDYTGPLPATDPGDNRPYGGGRS